MFKLTRLTATVLIVTSCLTGPAIGQQTAKSDPKPGDPNERVCENITLTGSRLGVKRFCGTRAQWDDKRLQDRQAVEQVQRSPCVIQTTGATGRPGC